MSANEKCPFCSSPKRNARPAPNGAIRYECGYWSDAYDERSPLCKALERAQRAESENANLRELLDRAYRYVPFPPDTEDCGCDECKFITEIRAEYSQLTKKTNE